MGVGREEIAQGVRESRQRWCIAVKGQVQAGVQRTPLLVQRQTASGCTRESGRLVAWVRGRSRHTWQRFPRAKQRTACPG